jgi:hypothetical protein
VPEAVLWLEVAHIVLFAGAEAGIKPVALGRNVTLLTSYGDNSLLTWCDSGSTIVLDFENDFQIQRRGR